MPDPSGIAMTKHAAADRELLSNRALAGDELAFSVFFDFERESLRRMIRLRLDRRLSGRVDSDDVLQDAYIEARSAPPPRVESLGGLRLPCFL